jgi:hypothetical protein
MKKNEIMKESEIIKKLYKSRKEQTIARTTIRPNSQVIREKNDLEVFPFYCVDIRGNNVTLIISYMHTELTAHRDVYNNTSIELYMYYQARRKKD